MKKIYTNVHTLYSSDITTITSTMPWIIQTAIDCYAGSCTNCRRHAVVCQGGLQNNWWHKSQHLKASGVTRLNITDAYRLTLQGLIGMRLRNAARQIFQTAISATAQTTYMYKAKPNETILKQKGTAVK